MKLLLWAWTLTGLLLGSTDVEASRQLRDFSGDPMQGYDSRMMSSPMTRFPGVFRITPWPYIIYPPAPSMTIVDVQIHIPELHQQPTTASTPPARPKFWIARCGGYVELDVNPTMSLMDEERKACSP
jgi:hypothetical protein